MTLSHRSVISATTFFSCSNQNHCQSVKGTSSVPVALCMVCCFFQGDEFRGKGTTGLPYFDCGLIMLCGYQWIWQSTLLLLLVNMYHMEILLIERVQLVLSNPLYLVKILGNTEVNISHLITQLASILLVKVPQQELANLLIKVTKERNKVRI